MPHFVTRFAPSPTGYLHLGHAFSALTVFAAAKKAQGRFILRIEDIDTIRCRPEFETAIFEDLQWLGIDWPTPVRRQSDHFADYQKALNSLIAKDVVYRCFKSRKEIIDEIARAPHLAPQRPEGPVFVGAALPSQEEANLLAASAPYAWRLSMQAARKVLGKEFEALTFIEQDADGERERVIRAAPQLFGDIIIARKDLGTSYHLASVYDDALQGVTHVIRGEDLHAAAHLHALLQALLELPRPRYRHHRLIVDESGKRLAKRDRAATLRDLRERGVAPVDVKKRLGFTE